MIREMIKAGKTAKEIGIAQWEYDRLVRNMEVTSGKKFRPPDMPTVPQMAKNAAGAIKDAAFSGFKKVSPEETERRKAICEDCELFNQDSRRCGACGCWIDFKSLLEAWHCPIKKW